MPYSVEAATEFGSGQGVNGYGKRSKISGFYVVNPQGRRCRAFTGKDAEINVIDWCKVLNDRLNDN